MSHLLPFSSTPRRFASIYVLSLLFVLAASVLFVPPLQADAFASANISITNVTITPSAGTVVFTAPWTAEAFAQAQNSFGEDDPEYKSSLGSQVQVNAAVTFASGQALADPVNLVLKTSSLVYIPDPVTAAANSVGRADIFNSTFMITGGTGQVNVNFSAMLKSMQSLLTTGGGIFASSEVIYSLLVNGNLVSSFASFNAIGPNDSWNPKPISELETGMMTLNYDEDYTIYLEADAETEGINVPEPSTITLLFGGPALAFVGRLIKAKRA